MWSRKAEKRMRNVRTVWHLEHLAEKFINSLAEQVGPTLLTKFHESDITDKTKQARQGRVISFHTPFMFMKGRILKESDYALERENKNIKVTTTHHRGHFSSDSSQNPEDTLKIEHPPKMCRVLLVQHANKHDAEERQVHKKVND